MANLCQNCQIISEVKTAVTKIFFNGLISNTAELFEIIYSNALRSIACRYLLRDLKQPNENRIDLNGQGLFSKKKLEAMFHNFGCLPLI